MAKYGNMPWETYKARPRTPLHPLVASRFFTRWFFFLDIMHMMDCKGVASIVFGSLLLWLSRSPNLGPNILDRMKAINKFMKDWYAAHPGHHRLPKLKHANLISNGWGDLHGPAVKAANTRAASGLFAKMAETYLSAENEFEKYMILATKHLHSIYTALNSAPRFPTHAEIAKIRRVTLRFGEAMMWCREHSRRLGFMAWEITPKVHKSQHLPTMCQVMNPKFVSCYADESLIGTTTRVWKRSMAGRYHANVQHVVLLKRLVGLILRLS